VRLGEDVADFSVTSLRILLGPFRQRLPNFLLPSGIVSESEGHQVFERHVTVAICLDELRADHRQLEPLLDHARRDAELGRDSVIPLPFVGQLLERLELVGGMHGASHFVFRQADLVRVLVALDHAARNLRFVLVLLLRLGKVLERGEATASSDHLELPAIDGANGQVVE
jgi:hypothetical protein